MGYKLYDEENTLIMIPGPIEFHPRIIRQMARKIYGHRTDYFRNIIADVHEKLGKLFGLKNGVVLSLSGSGTLAMDASLRSLATKEDIILNFVCGKFSERFLEISMTIPHKRIITQEVKSELKWGQAFTVERVRMILDSCEDKNLEPSLVTLCHNETSTGVIIDLKAVAHTIKKKFPSSLLIVDGITSIGAVPVSMEEFKVDVFITGSQKCLETPPGLSFVALSETAVEKLKKHFRDDNIAFDSIAGYYNHLALYLYSWLRKKDLPFTGAVPLYYALQAALTSILEEGLNRRFKRISLISSILRRALRSMGLRLLLEVRDNVDIDKYSSPTVTAVSYPERIRGKEGDKQFRSIIRNLGILIAGGQSELKGHIFRVATMGSVGPREIIATVGAIEYALRKMGYEPAKSGVAEVLRLMERENIEEIL